MVKLTFSLDETTVEQLRRAADRLGKPQSQVVREAISDYAARIGKLSEEERVQLLKTFDTVVGAISRRPLREVEREIAEVRKARRQAGQRRSRRTV
jgi:uncharacterized tellurite resistance protein B-like protein